MFYINIENGKINGGSELANSRFWTDDYFQIEVTEDEYNAIISEQEKFLYDTETNSIIENPDYEAAKAEETNNIRVKEIKQELKLIDEQRIRAMAEPSVKDEETGETWLEYYNSQAAKLRDELNSLEN